MITTIVLKILLIIIAVIVILLHFSVVIYISGGTSGKPVIRAKYLGITLYPRKKKEKKKKRRKKKDKDEDIAGTDDIDDIDEALDDIYDDEDEVYAVSEEKPDTTAETPVDEVTLPDEDDDNGSEEDTAEEVTEDVPDTDTDSEDGKKPRKRKKRKKKKEEKDEPSEEKGESKLDGLKRKWEFIKPYIPPTWKYSKKLLKAIRIEDVKINIETGKEDAAESATFYGKLQGALFNTLNLLAMIFTLRVKEANVRCLFNEKRLDAAGEANIRVRPSTVIAIAFCLLWCCGKIFIPYKLKKRRERKKAEKEAKKKSAAETSAAGQTA